MKNHVTLRRALFKEDTAPIILSEKKLKIIRNSRPDLMGTNYCGPSGVRRHTVSDEPVPYTSTINM